MRVVLNKDGLKAQTNHEAVTVALPSNQYGQIPSESQNEQVSDAEPMSEYTLDDDTLGDQGQGEDTAKISYDSNLLMTDSEDNGFMEVATMWELNNNNDLFVTQPATLNDLYQEYILIAKYMDEMLEADKVVPVFMSEPVKDGEIITIDEESSDEGQEYSLLANDIDIIKEFTIDADQRFLLR